ncbi:MAG: hypothetical protein WCI94_19140 [Rhodospirillales bacterium]
MKSRLAHYGAHADPLVATSNFVAMVLAWNQPCYPLYLWFVVGSDAWIEAPDILSGLFFLAIPPIARHCPLLGRALLPMFGVANILAVSWILGEAAGVWLLFFPCGMLAALSFRWHERWWMLGLSALPMLAWLATWGRLGAPLLSLSVEQTASIWTMNAMSAFAATIFFGWVFARSAARDTATGFR